MRSLVFVCLCLLPLTGIQAQVRNGCFPCACLGTWEGTMHLYSGGVLKDSVDVRLTVTDLGNGTWGWRTDYLSSKMPATKNYKLRWKDPAGSIYELDEGEGLVLKGYAVDNRLYSVFETRGILLTSTYELIGDRLVFEVTSGKPAESSHPEVRNYSVDHVQRVVLNRTGR